MYLDVEQIVSLSEANLQKLNHPLLHQYGVELNILRLDKIHPVISGNKFFKLRFFVDLALRYKKSIATFGGPWSNHLHATAYTCNRLNISCTGLIRGERPATLSKTLLDCESLGMHLEFIPRQQYREALIPYYEKSNILIIPEGGASELGVQGASTILKHLNVSDYHEIICSVGTGTMMAGLLQQSTAWVRGISALKIPSTDNSIEHFLQEQTSNRNFSIDYRFHFGGYAKKSLELITFMNEFYRFTGIPTDMVYTGKMFFGILQMIKEGTIQPGNKICAIHSGGLQGNRSLAEGTLVY